MKNNVPQQLTRRRFLLACGAAAAGYGAYACLGRDAQLRKCDRTSAALGSKVSITVFHRDEQLARVAIDSALAEIARVESVMSLYRSDSQLCKLNRDGVLNDPNPYLVQVLRYAIDIAAKSGGAFDPTVQPLWQIYASAKQQGSFPTADEISESLKLVNYRNIAITDREIRLFKPGMAVTLNGIAQGFASDCAMNALKQRGIEHALVNAGEIASLGQKSPADPWRVGIQHPREKDSYIGVAKLDGRCLSTSGDYESSFSADLTLHHIVDPTSGRSPETFASVSVAAPTAMQADALSTAIFVLGPDRGLQLARSMARTDVMFVLKDGRTLKTGGFPTDAEVSHVAG